MPKAYSHSESALVRQAYLAAAGAASCGEAVLREWEGVAQDEPLVSLVPVEQQGLYGRDAVNGCWMGLS